MIEALDVAVTPALAAAREPAPVAAVIDVLRASTSIVAALDNGAAGVIPTRDVDEALAMQRRLGRDYTRLAGERDAKLIPGFDIDNSPASFTSEKVVGRTIIMSTTNGTRAFQAAAQGKGLVLCGALVNRAALVRLLAEREDSDALLICAGNSGALSFEDLLAAGAIVERPGELLLAPYERAVQTRLFALVANAAHLRALAAFIGTRKRGRSHSCTTSSRRSLTRRDSPAGRHPDPRSVGAQTRSLS